MRISARVLAQTGSHRQAHQRRGNRDHWATIVGVVRHIRFNQLAGDESSSVISQTASKGVYYFPTFEAEPPFGFLIAKTSGNPEILAGAIRQAVSDTDPTSPSLTVKSMDLPQLPIAGRRFADHPGRILRVGHHPGGSRIVRPHQYSVTQRTNEIGIRMALGAARSDVLRMVFRQGAKLILAGAATGISIGLALMRALQSALYGVSAADPSLVCRRSSSSNARGAFGVLYPGAPRDEGRSDGGAAIRVGGPRGRDRWRLQTRIMTLKLRHPCTQACDSEREKARSLPRHPMRRFMWLGMFLGKFGQGWESLLRGGGRGPKEPDPDA